MISNQLSDLLGEYGDFPIKGTVKVIAPAGLYFASANVFGDTTMTAMEVNGVANNSDSYFNKIMPGGMWHVFTSRITAITLSGGELQCWTKPIGG